MAEESEELVSLDGLLLLGDVAEDGGEVALALEDEGRQREVDRQQSAAHAARVRRHMRAQHLLLHPVAEARPIHRPLFVIVGDHITDGTPE